MVLKLGFFFRFEKSGKPVINVPVGWNNYTRHGNLREFFFSSEKIVLENGKKARKYKFNLCFLIILTSIEPFPNKGDNHATFLSAMECEIFQLMPLLFCTLLGNIKKYSYRVEKIMPGTEMPEE